MTDSKALIERLRDNFDLTECEHGFRLYGELTCPNKDCDRRDIRQAADHIEKLEADNARLREANGILEDGLQEVGDDYPGSSCQEWCQHQIKQARAALQETSR